MRKREDRTKKKEGREGKKARKYISYKEMKRKSCDSI